MEPRIDPKLEVLRREIATFLHELPRLLAEGHKDKFVLIQGDQVVDVFDDYELARDAGIDRFGLDETFLAQPIEQKYLDFPWPTDWLPRKAV